MDHERVNIHTTSMSCGVMELSRINNDLEGVCYALASRLYHPARGEPCAFFVWSDVADEEQLSSFVKAHGFGLTGRSSYAENPKTGNCIAVYYWEIDHQKFKAWYQHARVKRIGTVGT